MDTQIRKNHRKFVTRFTGVSVVSKSTTLQIMNKFRRVGSLLNKQQQQTLRVLSKETSDGVGARLEASAWKILRRLSQQFGVSTSSVQASSKNETMRIYSCAKLQDADCAAQIRFCNCFCEALRSGDVGPLVTCLTDKARYYLDVHYLLHIAEGGRQIIANWLALSLSMVRHQYNKNNRAQTLSAHNKFRKCKLCRFWHYFSKICVLWRGSIISSSSVLQLPIQHSVHWLPYRTYVVTEKLIVLRGLPFCPI